MTHDPIRMPTVLSSRSQTAMVRVNCGSYQMEETHDMQLYHGTAIYANNLDHTHHQLG